MPTLLEIAGAETVPGLDGRSLGPLLLGGQVEDWRQAIFAEYLGHQNGDIALKILRTQTHKLVLTASGPDELFDLVADPGELENRIDEPLCRAVLSDLAERLAKRMDDSHDPLRDTFALRLAHYQQKPE